MELKEQADKVIRELLTLLKASCDRFDAVSQVIDQHAKNLRDPMWMYGFKEDEDAAEKYATALHTLAAEMREFRDKVIATDLDWEFTKKPTLFERANE